MALDRTRVNAAFRGNMSTEDVKYIVTQCGYDSASIFGVYDSLEIAMQNLNDFLRDYVSNNLETIAISTIFHLSDSKQADRARNVQYLKTFLAKEQLLEKGPDNNGVLQVRTIANGCFMNFYEITAIVENAPCKQTVIMDG